MHVNIIIMLQDQLTAVMAVNWFQCQWYSRKMLMNLYTHQATSFLFNLP